MHAHHEHSVPAHGAASDWGRAFVIGIALNAAFAAIEAAVGWSVHSLALLADAGHNLGDVVGLLLAALAALAARRSADARHTYGWRRVSVLAGFVNALFLALAMLVLISVALQRLAHPQALAAGLVMVVAAVGVLINGASALLFRAHADDLNVAAVFWHLLADALVSLAVVATGALYVWRHWTWLDPVASLLIAAVILYGAWRLLRQSLHRLVDAVPEHLDSGAIRARLLALEGVVDIHDLHIWRPGSTEVALTAHMVLSRQAKGEEVLHHALHLLADEFAIHHVTLQQESMDFHHSCQDSCQVC